MPTVLITGASSGLGLEFARQYTEADWTVFATCRDPDRVPALRQLVGHLWIYRLDVTAADQIVGLATAVRGRPIDLLIHNAGVTGREPAGTSETGSFRTGVPALDAATAEGCLEAFRVNALGPLQLTAALLANLIAGRQRKLILISSGLASITDDTAGGHYAYRMSKAAANMAFRTLAADLEPLGIAAIALCPGWVRTRIGGGGAPIAPAEAVVRLRRQIDRLSVSDSGRFLTKDGVPIPW